MKSIHKDPIWDTVRMEAKIEAEKEPLLASFLHATILNHGTLDNALAFILASKLASDTLLPISLMELIASVFESDAGIRAAIRADLAAIRDRDPACRELATPLLFFKGFHSLQSYRVSHWLWNKNRAMLALTIQSRVSEVFAVDIHPAARIGKGILMDHATGVVVGETAVIGDNVSMLHQVTLGGTGKETGDRHPKIGDGVLISTGATILGNVRIGVGAKIGAGSVVLTDIPPHCTAVGVPAKVCGHPQSAAPALEMNHDVTHEVQDDEAQGKAVRGKKKDRYLNEGVGI